MFLHLLTTLLKHARILTPTAFLILIDHPTFLLSLQNSPFRTLEMLSLLTASREISGPLLPTSLPTLPSSPFLSMEPLGFHTPRFPSGLSTSFGPFTGMLRAPSELVYGYLPTSVATSPFRRVSSGTTYSEPFSTHSSLCPTTLGASPTASIITTRVPAKTTRSSPPPPAQTGPTRCSARLPLLRPGGSLLCSLWAGCPDTSYSMPLVLPSTVARMLTTSVPRLPSSSLTNSGSLFRLTLPSFHALRFSASASTLSVRLVCLLNNSTYSDFQQIVFPF